MFSVPRIFGQQKLALIGLGLGVAAVGPTYAQVGLGLNPLRVELKAVPSATESNSLVLSNETSATVRVLSSVLDFELDSDEQPQFRPDIPEQSAHSCRGWIKVNPTDFEIGAGKHQVVRYTVDFPKEIPEGSYQCALGFTTAPTASAANTGVVTNVRLITAFYMVAGRPTPSGDVQSIKIVPPVAESEKRRAFVVVQNTGTTYFRVTGTFEIVSEEGKLVESLPFRAIPVLPSAHQRFVFPLTSDYTPGQIARVKMDIGGGEEQEVTAPVAAIKPAQ